MLEDLAKVLLEATDIDEAFHHMAWLLYMAEEFTGKEFQALLVNIRAKRGQVYTMDGLPVH